MRLVGRSGLRRGVLILPSLFTLGNLFCGFYAMLEVLQGPSAGVGHFETAAVFIALAMVLDGLDGRIARLAHATSPLGMQLDSLADVVSFGVAPGLLVYAWALQDLGRAGWACAFVYAGCGALRLARFNVQSVRHHDNRYFVGLPIPGGAAALAALVFFWPDLVRERPGAALGVALWTLVLAMLMVSTIRYPSFKQLDLDRHRPLRTLLWVVLVFALIAAAPQVALASVAFLFTLSGPFLRVLALVRRRAPEEEASRPAEEPR